MNKLEDAFQVLSSLEEWFVRAFTHVRLEGYDDANLPGYRLLGLLKNSLQTFGSVARHAPGLWELFKRAAQGPYGVVRLAAVSSLGGALAGAYDDARAMLQTMARDRHEAYGIKRAAGAALREAQGAEATQDETAAGGGTAQGSLEGATGSASQSPEDLLKQLRQATKDRDGLVRAAALEALLKASLEELLEHYWSTPDARLIPYITPRLYHTPLVIAKGAQQVLLYAAAGQARKRREPQGVIERFLDDVKGAVDQLSQMDSRLSAYVDKSVWERYFDAVGEDPVLPDGLEAIMDSPCPFWVGRQVRDTHLLALIPSHVAGQPLTLDYLGDLITRPQGEDHGTKYRYYWDGIRKAIGNQSPSSSYWVLMTKDVLPGSRDKSYRDQCALVERHQGYAVPGALEAAVVVLLHHVRSGERLYSDNPYTYTRCRERVRGLQLVVGGFSSGGLSVDNNYNSSRSDSGIAGLRKF